MTTKNRPVRGGDARRAHRAWPSEMRVEAARAVVERKTPCTMVSRAFGVPLTTVMEWARRYRQRGASDLLGKPGPRKGSAKAGRLKSADDARRRAVTEAKRDHPEHGTRRIRDLMARLQGLGVSETTVRRILHEEGLLEERPPMAERHHPERRFERAEPNQLWQSDIFTFLLRRHERVYVAAFMDDYSRYLVSLVIAHHQRGTLVLEALARAVADYGAPREVLTDQGRQYTAWRGHTDFEEELRRQGIRHIKSRAHHPETLGKIERFWKTLWEELLSRTVFADFEDCQRRIGLYVQAYNFRRPHQGISGLVPADRFFRAAPQVRAAVERGVAENALELSRARPQRKPFYLVGRLGESDLSVALTGRGLFVKLGDVEQTIPLMQEDDDEQASASRRVAEESSAPDSEVADQVGGAGQGGAGTVPDGAERALGGETGDGCDQGGGDLAGDLLPAGDAGDFRDAAGAGAERGLGDRRVQPAAPGAEAGREGASPGAREAPGGASAAHDAAGDGPAENQLDEEWERSFAELEGAEEGGGQGRPPFDAGGDWRGRALTWERKLAGAREARHEEDLHPAAVGAGGDQGEIPGGHGGALRRSERERGSAAGESVPEPLPDPAAPGDRGAARGSERETERPAADAESGEGAARADGASAAGDREPAGPGGNDGSPPGSGGGAAAGSHAEGSISDAQEALLGGGVTSSAKPASSPPKP